MVPRPLPDARLLCFSLAGREGATAHARLKAKAGLGTLQGKDVGAGPQEAKPGVLPFLGQSRHAVGRASRLGVGTAKGVTFCLVSGIFTGRVAWVLAMGPTEQG